MTATTLQEQDVNRIKSLFFWVYPPILPPHHLFEPPRRSSTTVYHFFAGDFTQRPIRYDGASEANHFPYRHNKRRPTHIANLLFIMKLVILSTRDINIELIVMNIAMGYETMHNGATIQDTLNETAELQDWFQTLHREFRCSVIAVNKQHA